MPVRRIIGQPLARISTVFAVAALAPVAAPAVSASPIVVAQEDQSAAADLAREARVARVGYTLARAAIGLCPHPEAMSGMGLHDIASYAQADRAAVRSGYHLGTGFGVRFVVPGGAAARAGVQAGDEIVGVDSVDATSFAPTLIRTAGSPDRTERFTTVLREKLAAGPVSLRLRHDTATRIVQLTADAGCSGRFVVTPERALNAWSDGATVAITSILVDFVASDDELAYVLAHEMSHNMLGHAERTKHRSPVLASVGIGSGLIKTTEIEADQSAVKVMARAHYDPIAGETFLRRFAKARGFDLALTHPGTEHRINILRAARAALPGAGATSAPVQP